MSNNKNVLNRNYVSLEKFNKIKYDLYLKDNEMEYKTQCQNDIIQQQRAAIKQLLDERKQLLDERKYWYDECQKLSNNQNVNEQYNHDLKNFEQMYILFTKEQKEDKDKLEQNKDNEIENKNKEIERLKEDKEELKDKEIERLKEEKEKLNQENTKLRNKIIQVIDYYIDGKDIKEIILNLLKVNDNKDGE